MRAAAKEKMMESAWLVDSEIAQCDLTYKMISTL